MHVSMPPETPPPDDERRPSPQEGNVVDPEVLAERRAQRAEQAEQSAARRAADAQVLAAQLARERARIEAERDAARAEAAAAREGADAAIAEARHLQAERDALRAALEQARAGGGSDVAGAPAEAAGPVEDAAVPAEEAAGPVEDAAVPAGDAAGPVEDAAVPAGDAAGPATVNGAAGRSRNGAVVPLAWPGAFRRELSVARAAMVSAPSTRADPPLPAGPLPGLDGERRLLVQRAAAGPLAFRSAAASGAEVARERQGGRAAPVTALALERERSCRLQAQLDNSLTVQRELRTHIAALQQAVHRRVEAERRIEAALRRVREELTAANLLAAQRAPAAEAPTSAATEPAVAGTSEASPLPNATASETPTPTPTPTRPRPSAGLQAVREAPSPSRPMSAPVAGSASGRSGQTAPVATAPHGAAAPHPATTGAGLDPLRLSAARERLRAIDPPASPLAPLPAGTPAPWLTTALKRLLEHEPEVAGRIAVGLLPAQGLVAQRTLRYDLLLSGRGCFAVDVAPGSATVVPRSAPRPRAARDLSIASDASGFARLLHRRRGLRRPARVRGGRRALRELRRIARAPLGLRDLGAAGVALEPALALRLVALAIDPDATRGERFSIAHAPLAGGPVDAWLRIADGAAPEVCERAPSEPARLTLRSTRGALLALIAGVAPPPGEAGAYEGDEAALALLRSWIAQTEHPSA
jgi:hypothetical protein